MRARNQIRASLAFAHASGDAIIADCDESALYAPPGGNANTIGAIYLHAVFGEDFRFSQLVRAAPTVFATGGWANAVGIDLANPRLTADWAQIRFDRPAFRDYAQAVYAQTDATIAALSDEDLAREIRMGPVGNFTVASFTGDLLVFHFAAHMGEVAAIKGILGLKGLPF